jgi:hypothetical protein
MSASLAAQSAPATRECTGRDEQLVKLLRDYAEARKALKQYLTQHEPDLKAALITLDLS